VGREQAHEAIKEHAVAVALDLRQGGEINDLFDRLAADPRLGLTAADLDKVAADPLTFTGAAPAQVEAFVDQVAAVAGRFPEAAGYQPGAIF